VFDGRFRSGVDRAVKPIGGALKRTGLSPDHLTALGLVLAFPAAVAIATGHLGLGLGLLIGSAVPDLLDGALAKASGRASARGAFFDSVADRVTDTLVLGGVAWYLLDRYHDHVALLPMAVLGASQLISYERAKAESLGFEAKGGLMERAERVVVLCVGLAFSVLLIPILWLMLALIVFTAAQRFVKVWRQATAAGHGPPPAERPAFVRRSGYTFTEAAAVARWRAWRQANGWVPRSARYADGSHRSGAAARWQERRRARLARLSGDEGSPDATSATRRRSGSRRP
jgi:CDP-diacylglycerol--glycerol-3-phosphate 3-phosphatidyltransferase